MQPAAESQTRQDGTQRRFKIYQEKKNNQVQQHPHLWVEMLAGCLASSTAQGMGGALRELGVDGGDCG